jgi:hypothetical protein
MDTNDKLVALAEGSFWSVFVCGMVGFVVIEALFLAVALCVIGGVLMGIATYREKRGRA